ncbi:MAG: hypothetical protein KDJ65_00120 [Anaerolineae bacterium]|nr:hypothetical protein [Anaerolineae bacterium]
MDKLKALFRHPEFHGLFLFISVLLFVYPLLIVLNHGGTAIVLLSFFFPWALIILMLFAVSRSYTPEENEDVQNGRTDDV